MDFSNLSREDWKQRLSGQSLPDLRNMLKNHGVDLPHVTDRAAFVSAAYDIVCAPKNSVEGSGVGNALVSTSAPVSDSKPPAPEPSRTMPNTNPEQAQYKIRCKMGVRYRAGHKFSTVYQTLPEDHFTAEQWAVLRSDPCLTIAKV